MTNGQHKYLTPVEKYEKETGKSIWEIKDHTHTKEYAEWIKNYVKNSDSKEAVAVRNFIKKINNNKRKPNN
jgi:hypothetical protein